MAGQVGGGTLLTPVTFVVGGLASRALAGRFGASETTARRAAYVGAWSGAALGAATAPALVARGGAWPRAMGGALVGGAVAAGAVWVGRRVFGPRAGCNALCTTLGLVAFALPAAGATWAYNRSR